MKKFTIPIRPQAKQSVRATAMPSGSVVTYQDPKKKQYVHDLTLVAQAHRPSEPYEGPVHLEALFVMPRPQRLRYHAPHMHLHVARPDADNLMKPLKDALSAAQFWVDDCQVALETAGKVYAEDGKDPRIIVRVSELELRTLMRGLGRAVGEWT